VMRIKPEKAAENPQEAAPEAGSLLDAILDETESSPPMSSPPMSSPTSTRSPTRLASFGPLTSDPILIDEVEVKEYTSLAGRPTVMITYFHGNTQAFKEYLPLPSWDTRRIWDEFFAQKNTVGAIAQARAAAYAIAKADSMATILSTVKDIVKPGWYTPNMRAGWVRPAVAIAPEPKRRVKKLCRVCGDPRCSWTVESD